MAGDQEAYARLVKRYQRPIYYLALRMLRKPEDADDVTQRTFLKAYRALKGFEFRSSLKTWLTAIALNLCRTELMRPRREMVEIPPTLADPQYREQKEIEEREFQKKQLAQAMERLPTRQKEVVVLRIHHEMPFKEIAVALKSTETAVKVNFHHAMKSLREWVRKQVKDEGL